VLLVASNIDFDFVQVFDKVKVFVVIMMDVVELFDAAVVVVEHIVVATVVEIAYAAGIAFVAVAAVEVDIFVACFVDVVENIVVVAFVVEIASAEKTSVDFAFGVNYIWEVHQLDCLVPFDMENQQLGDLIVEN
jgi:hypothetical protein